jgi:hypothetical protein
MKNFLILSFVFCSFNAAFARIQTFQDTLRTNTKLRATILNGDTVALINLKPYYVFEKRVFKNKRKEKRYYVLIARVKKVLPIAREAGRLYKTLNSQLVNKSEKDKIFLMRRVENEIKRKYTKTIENLSYSEGMILLKLIDRETGNSAYHLVQELRGDFKAWIYQGVGHLFDVNLKEEYDPATDDKDIEDIIFLIDNGMV